MGGLGQAYCTFVKINNNLHSSHLYGHTSSLTEGSAVGEFQGQSCMPVQGSHGNKPWATTGDEWAIATGHTELWNRTHKGQISLIDALMNILGLEC